MVTRVYYLLQKYCRDAINIYAICRDAINRVSTFLIVVFICFLFIYFNYNNALAFSPSSDYQPIQVIDGAGLYQKKLNQGNVAYLQVINLREMKIDQLVGEVDNMGITQGKYYQGEGNYYSPFFERELYLPVTEEYKNLYGDTVFSIINCSFFEQYKSSSQLSFPVKLNGKVISAGNSPYGPVRKPADKYYSNIRLKALVWDEKQAYIADYNPTTGFPLNQKNVQNAIVTYKYSDHPSKVLAKNQVNKFHVLGTLNKDRIKGDELLLIVTVNRANLDNSENLLRKLGVKSDIITIDGGTSTFIFNSQQGNILLPQTGNLGDNPTVRNLPHYLGFRSKNKNNSSPKIFVNQPTNRVQIQKNKPYLILWRDNLNGDVRIDVYDKEKRIQEISRRTPSNGVFEWIPRSPVKDGYVIRVSSIGDKNIFGSLNL
jgi:hypothetical protein